MPAQKRFVILSLYSATCRRQKNVTLSKRSAAEGEGERAMCFTKVPH